MKIIDAHFHLFPDVPFVAEQLRAVRHEGSVESLLRCQQAEGIVAGIVMGNDHLEPEAHCYPAPFYYCIGLDDQALEGHSPAELPALVEQNLRREQCVGIKLYTGYTQRVLSDPFYDFVYEMAARYHKPVAAHMGMTAGPGGLLRCSHPLTMDEVAVRHPEVDFVMCHFGNPFLAEAAAVLEKNDNVYADLSGLVEGIKDWDPWFEAQSGYVQLLRT